MYETLSTHAITHNKTYNIEWNLMKRRHFFTSVKTLRFETKVVQKSEFGPYALTKR